VADGIRSFGTVLLWIEASLPVIVGAMAITGTLLALFVLGSLTDVSVFAINLTTALGLGLGIDYSLFIVSRFREEMGNGLAPHDASCVRWRRRGAPCCSAPSPSPWRCPR